MSQQNGWSRHLMADGLPLVSLLAFFPGELLVCFGILERRRFSFPLSQSLSDVRSVSLFALRARGGLEVLDVETPFSGTLGRSKIIFHSHFTAETLE